MDRESRDESKPTRISIGMVGTLWPFRQVDIMRLENIAIRYIMRHKPERMIDEPGCGLNALRKNRPKHKR